MPHSQIPKSFQIWVSGVEKSNQLVVSGKQGTFNGVSIQLSDQRRIVFFQQSQSGIYGFDINSSGQISDLTKSSVKLCDWTSGFNPYSHYSIQGIECDPILFYGACKYAHGEVNPTGSRSRSAQVVRNPELNQRPVGVIYYDASKLRPLDPISYSSVFTSVPMYWRGCVTVMSCGDFAIPEKRPSNRDEWNLWRDCEFLKPITALQWPSLIRSVNGCYMSEVFPSGRLGEDVLTHVRQVLKNQNKHNSSKPQSNTGCFYGYSGTNIEFKTGCSVRIVWELRGAGNSKIYVVDTPQVGALYIFENQKDAHDWASGNIQFQQARKKALEWFIHRDEWEEKVRLRLELLGVK